MQVVLIFYEYSAEDHLNPLLLVIWFYINADDRAERVYRCGAPWSTNPLEGPCYVESQKCDGVAQCQTGADEAGKTSAP